MGSEPPLKPGCSEANESLLERAGEYLRDIIRH
jgi:hypothetical protein